MDDSSGYPLTGDNLLPSVMFNVSLGIPSVNIPMQILDQVDQNKSPLRRAPPLWELVRYHAVRLSGLIDSALNYRSLPPELEPRL